MAHDAEGRDALAAFIAQPLVRERHEVRVRAPAGFTHRVAREFDMQSVAWIRWTFRARERLLGARPVSRTSRGLVSEMSSLGWGCLIDEPTLFAAGAACQPWLADVAFRAIPAERFARDAPADHVKIAWTIETRPVGSDACELASETRVVATDDAARARFLRYWRWARFGIVGIRLILLPAIARRAERAWREQRPSFDGAPHER